MYKIIKAEKLNEIVYLMVVEAPMVAKHCQPGQFIIVKEDDAGERIPLTICDYDREAGTVTIVFQPIGDDGSYGRSGMVTKVIDDLIAEGKTYTKCVAIGPMIMMKFCCLTTQKYNIPTIVSMNPIMVDGTGMCGACRVIVGDEVKFACVDGPEFDGHLIDWNLAMQRQQMYKTEEGRALLKLREGDTHHGGCGQCGGDK